MNITLDVIKDLMPLYLSGECSRDTKLLIEEQFKKDPNLKREVDKLAGNPIPEFTSSSVGRDDEMNSLLKMRRVLKMRSYIMGAAIFFTLVPLSFLHVDGKTYWLFLESPNSAFIYLPIGIGLWLWYFAVKRKSSDQ